jgi:purine-binding chemotaxis protein CheW
MTATAAYVTLGVDSELFAVPVTCVREILDLCPVARLPHAPPYLVGMIDVRGDSVPVVDLRAKLGLAPAAATAATRILVLEIAVPAAGGPQQLVLGLITDRVFEVTDLDGGRLDPPPEIGVRWRSDYMVGIGRRGQAFVVVFDLPRLFASEAAALLEPAA